MYSLLTLPQSLSSILTSESVFGSWYDLESPSLCVIKPLGLKFTISELSASSRLMSETSSQLYYFDNLSLTVETFTSLNSRLLPKPEAYEKVGTVFPRIVSSLE